MSRVKKLTQILGDDWILRLMMAGVIFAAGISYWLDASSVLFGLAILPTLSLLILSSPARTRSMIAPEHPHMSNLGNMQTLNEHPKKSYGTPVSTDRWSLHMAVNTKAYPANFFENISGKNVVGPSKMAPTNAILYSSANSHACVPQIPRSQTPSGDEILAALADGQITAWFQPQVSADTGHIAGFEALARWNHPSNGIISPSKFLPALAKSQHMEILSETILQHSLEAMGRWDKSGVEVPSVSVNFSTQELRNPSLTERIKWDVDRYELDPGRLTVEILETVVSKSDDDVISRNIRALHAQGFSIDLDDFGTSHASLANIRRFCVDRIKIDRSFIVDVDKNPAQQRMIAAIVGMAERLGIQTLAEGVETPTEHGILSQLGCTYLQGFSIAKPMPFEKTIRWVREHEAAISQTYRIGRRTG